MNLRVRAFGGRATGRPESGLSVWALGFKTCQFMAAALPGLVRKIRPMILLSARRRIVFDPSDGAVPEPGKGCDMCVLRREFGTCWVVQNSTGKWIFVSKKKR